MKYGWFCVIMILSFASNLQAQDTEGKINDWWISGGMAVTKIEMGTNLSVNTTFSKMIVKARYSFSSTFLDWDSPTIEARECGVLVGRYFDDDTVTLSASAGLAYTSGMNRGDIIGSGEGWLGGIIYEELPWRTFGIPLELQFNFNTFKYIGVGLTAYCNLNLYRNMYGVSLNLLFGKLTNLSRNITLKPIGVFIR